MRVWGTCYFDELGGRVGFVVVVGCIGLRASAGTHGDPRFGPYHGQWSSLLSIRVVPGPPVVCGGVIPILGGVIDGVAECHLGQDKVNLHVVLVVWLGVHHLEVIIFLTTWFLVLRGRSSFCGVSLVVRQGAVFGVWGPLGLGVPLVSASHMEDRRCQSSSEAVFLPGLEPQVAALCCS